jgi:protein-L-isoaspartate(D-aspartate) O-methyltransferase
MVDNQIRTSGVVDHAVLQAFLTVPREIFVDTTEQPFAYTDRDVKMSARSPHRSMMPPAQLARLLQALELPPESHAMLVGAGTGYSATILALIAGSVIAVEEDADLAASAEARLKNTADISLVERKLIEGNPEGAPYDAILVDGAVETLPSVLIEQLKPTAKLATIVRDERISRAILYERVGARADHRPLFEAWAPLLPGFERAREFVF